MGVESIGGIGPDPLAGHAAAPAPQLRPVEGAEPAVPKARRSAELKEEQVQQTARKEHTAPKVVSSGTRLRVDEATQRIVAQIVDENDVVIRQIPPEELLRIAEKFRRLQGLLFDRQA